MNDILGKLVVFNEYGDTEVIFNLVVSDLEHGNILDFSAVIIHINSKSDIGVALLNKYKLQGEELQIRTVLDDDTKIEHLVIEAINIYLDET